MVSLNITSTVKRILQNYPETRDNDNVLIIKVWAEERPEIKVEGFLMKDFALMFKRESFSSTETIRRTRQKLQQENIELRGEKYYQRHKNEDNVVEQLGQPEFFKGGTP